MQFQLTVLCLGIYRHVVEGQDQCYAVIARQPESEDERDQHRGYLVQQVTAEPRLFEQMTWLNAPATLSFLCTISAEPGSHYRPHLLGLCH